MDNHFLRLPRVVSSAAMSLLLTLTSTGSLGATQPSPKMDACGDAAAQAVTTQSPLPNHTIRVIIACFTPAKAAQYLQTAMAHLVRSANPSLRALNSHSGSSPNETVAYRDSAGNFISVETNNARLHANDQGFRGFADARDVVPVTTADAPGVLQQQRQQLTNTINNNAVASAVASTQNAQQPIPRHCPFQAPSQAAANGGVALAASSAIYTRSWLGILALLVPIIFAQCQQNNVTVNLPVITPSTQQVIIGGTPGSIQVSENAYSGAFAVKPSNEFVTVTPTTSGQTTMWAITGTTAGAVVITATDAFGHSTTANVTVVPGAPKGGGS